MKIKETGYMRKIDPMGRVGIPVKIRREYDIEEGAEYPIVLIHSDDGNVYCGINVGHRLKSRTKIEKMINDLDTLNVTIPDELFDMLDE
jgi:bifunctional DNA-binding transcriptional regulator/antitoxin component of YhaV-PrlF toxin-antitoxin module